jgi:hypothetical protein
VDNAVPRADGTGGYTAQGSDIVIDDATTSTQNNVAIVNAHAGQTNSALVLTPKGTGAFILGPKPDGTSTGGNARGTNSICLVRNRGSATQVASGTNAVAIGNAATASSQQSLAIHGTASGDDCIAIGISSASNSATGNIAIGRFTECSAGGVALTIGHRATCNAHNGAALGISTLADRRGMFAFQGRASFSGTNNGQIQRSLFTLSQKTTTNSAVELTTTGDAVAAGLRLTCRSGFVLAMTINIVGVKSDGSAVAHYLRQYSIKNVSATTSEVYAPVTLGTDNAAGTSIAISADDTNDSLKIEVTGTTSEIWRWHALVDANELQIGT